MSETITRLRYELESAYALADSKDEEIALLIEQDGDNQQTICNLRRELEWERNKPPSAEVQHLKDIVDADRRTMTALRTENDRLSAALRTENDRLSHEVARLQVQIIAQGKVYPQITFQMQSATINDQMRRLAIMRPLVAVLMNMTGFERREDEHVDDAIARFAEHCTSG